MKHHATLFPNGLAAALIGLTLTACGGPSDTDRTTLTDSSATEVSQAATAERLALVPGTSVGPFKLGDADSLVHQQLGRPDHSNAAMGKAVLIWYADTASGYPLSIFTTRDMGNDETARIQQIRVTSPTFETADSIHVGSTLTQIRTAYPVTAIETYSQAGETYTVYEADDGIAFEVGPDDHCVAIIIHQTDAGMSSYLPLRPSMTSNSQ
ncbi:hypothetical protein [Parapedobacter sp. 10938]|uniref:hypothetical protein n=1 Tax=Parapedobacter flavus TaxID=3110225 RepID=UPI002DB8C992|nr:hypothetical protein [Parapedobacter sp. 10938]MEC3877994.1 hypothetical protein [Parapedobacter sp. 10938]